MFDVLAYVLFVLVIIGLLRYVMGGIQNAEAPQAASARTKGLTTLGP